MTRRRVLKGGILIVVTFVLLELTSYLAYFIIYRHPYSHGDVIASRARVLEDSSDGDAFQVGGVAVPFNVDIHPYYGFGEPSGFDFLTDDAVPAQTDANGVVVAVTGGSMAFNMFNSSAGALQESIATIPRFRDKNVYVVLLGFYAWKQPQQLEALTYYLAMGGQLDLLINLDGHNEIVDTGTNYGLGVFPGYPWTWYHLTSNIVPVEQLRTIGQVTLLRDVARGLARLFSYTPYLVTTNVVWVAANDLIASRINQQIQLLATLGREDAESRPFSQFGPQREIDSWQELLEYSVQIWKHSSIQLHRIVSGNGADYFHFLQPNQYVPDSKVLTEQERREAFTPPRQDIVLGYEELLRVAPELENAGVNFHSLVNIFENVSETVYADNCCHVNARGNQLMGTAIGTAIHRHYENVGPTNEAPR